MSIHDVRFRSAKVSELRSQYMFALAHLCHVRPNDNLKLRDFFQLIMGIDQYIEESNRVG